MLQPEVVVLSLLKRTWGGGEDVDAVTLRIEKYIEKQQYLSAPEGSVIPDRDDSSYIRC